jgi:hypothetical protein
MDVYQKARGRHLPHAKFVHFDINMLLLEVIKTKMKIYFNGCRVEPAHLYSDINQLALNLNVMQFLAAVTVLSFCFSWLWMSSQVFVIAF